KDELGPFLEEALKLLVEAAQARCGYLEIYDEEAVGEAPRWWIAHGFSEEEVAGVRDLISQGIIAAAVASGETVITASARVDDRFRERPSVQRGQIDAVLCAPVGEGPPHGVLYLQGRAASGPFSAEDQARVELCARHLAPVADRLTAQQTQRHASDPTAEPRRRLRADG